MGADVIWPMALAASAESIESYRKQCSDLSRAEIDMVILATLCRHQHQHPLCTLHKISSCTKLSSASKRTLLSWWEKSVHTISDKRLHNLEESLGENGLTPRRHGNARRLPANTVTFADTQRVVEFLHTYAEANAILLPGRIPGYKRTDEQLLPSSTTKHQVWKQYCSSLTTNHQVANSTFCSNWWHVVPEIMVTQPMSDLCCICQSNSTAIMSTANQPEEQKS